MNKLFITHILLTNIPHDFLRAFYGRAPIFSLASLFFFFSPTPAPQRLKTTLLPAHPKDLPARGSWNLPQFTDIQLRTLSGHNRRLFLNCEFVSNLDSVTISITTLLTIQVREQANWHTTRELEATSPSIYVIICLQRDYLYRLL